MKVGRQMQNGAAPSIPNSRSGEKEIYRTHTIQQEVRENTRKTPNKIETAHKKTSANQQMFLF